MNVFHLDKHPHVELCDLLKLQGWSESGAAAKQAIAAGEVTSTVIPKPASAAKSSPVRLYALAANRLPFRLNAEFHNGTPTKKARKPGLFYWEDAIWRATITYDAR